MGKLNKWERGRTREYKDMEKQVKWKNKWNRGRQLKEWVKRGE